MLSWCTSFWWKKTFTFVLSNDWLHISFLFKESYLNAKQPKANSSPVIYWIFQLNSQHFGEAEIYIYFFCFLNEFTFHFCSKRVIQMQSSQKQTSHQLFTGSFISILNTLVKQKSIYIPFVFWMNSNFIFVQRELP